VGKNRAGVENFEMCETNFAKLKKIIGETSTKDKMSTDECASWRRLQNFHKHTAHCFGAQPGFSKPAENAGCTRFVSISG
jgi:hypothetical protein